MISDDSLTLWKEHVYPLKHVIIKLQGTRHSNREDLIGLLHLVLERLKQGSDHGKTEDDDFGYFFSFDSKLLYERK